MRVGILCGGGPAPGINAVISAATIEARNTGWDVVGIRDGFEHLIQGDAAGHAERLSIGDVSRIHVMGGSILYTSRANPTVTDKGANPPDWRLRNCLRTVGELGLDALVTIGGDDTVSGAAAIARASRGAVRIAHVPKTIDDDLPLPGGMPTFGFETARHYGVQTVNNLMTDAMTSRRWFFVVAMGRTAGHLALGIGKAAGATLTIIGEEFPEGSDVRLDHLADILEAAMFKRRAAGRPFGVAILAEGLGLRLPAGDLARALPEAERDEYGNVRLADLHLHRLLTDIVTRRFADRGERVTIVAKNIGYELRCAPPIPFDIAYARDLGYGAIDYLRSSRDGEGAMITIRNDHMVPLPFDAFLDPETGRSRIRRVDLSSNSYRVAREYMIRLEADDLADPASLSAVAKVAGMTPSAFKERFAYLV